VKKVSLRGGPPTTLATGEYLTTLTIDAENVYVGAQRQLALGAVCAVRALRKVVAVMRGRFACPS